MEYQKAWFFYYVFYILLKIHYFITGHYNICLMHGAFEGIGLIKQAVGGGAWIFTSHFFVLVLSLSHRVSVLVSKRTSCTSKVLLQTNRQLDALSVRLCDFCFFCSFRGQGHGAKGENEYEFSLEFLKPVKPEVTAIFLYTVVRNFWKHLYIKCSVA